MALNPLLQRQIARAAQKAAGGGIDLDALLRLVSDAYDQMDRDRRLNDRAVALLQEELGALKVKWKDDAEVQIKAVMDIVGEAVISIDERGTVLAFNQAAERMFGWSRAEVLGHNVTMLMTEQHATHHDATLARYLRTGQSRIIGVGREAEAKRKNGEIFPVEINVGEMLAQGPGRRFIGIIRDITQRKRVEQELRESESRFRDLAGSASDWFWETDAEHRMTFISDRVREVVGMDPANMIGKTRFETSFVAAPQDIVAHHRADLEARRPFRDLVFTLDHPERGRLTIRISGIPVFDASGVFLGYRGTGSNITREAAAEERAIQAHEQLIQAIDSVTDGFALFDADDRLVICNRQYREMFEGIADIIVRGARFEEIATAALDRGIFPYVGEERARWLENRMAEHRHPSGNSMLHRIGDRWFQSRDYRSSDGSTVVIRSEVTALKARELELEALRHRYEMILQSAGEGIIGLDTDGRITFANSAACRMLGWSQEDMVSIKEHCLFHHSHEDGAPYPVACCTIHLAMVRGEEHSVSDEVFWRADGTGFPVEYAVAPIREAGVLAGAVLLFRNITLRKQYQAALADQQKDLERLVEERTSSLRREISERGRTEAALAASQSRLRSITANLFEGVVVVDENGHVIFANPSAQQLLLGDAERPLTGRELDIFVSLLVDGREVDFADSPFHRVATGDNTVQDDDALFRLRDGTTIPVGYACSPLVEGGKLRGAIISFRNIAALKAAQQEAVQASRLASVGQLAAGIAHEINTPIQYIGDNLRFIGDSFERVLDVLHAVDRLEADVARGGDIEPALQAVTAAKENAELQYLIEEIPTAAAQSLDGVAQVSEIVRSMKDFSHPGTTNKVATDINRAIESTVTVSRNEWKHWSTVDLDLDPTLPLVTCLPGAINQVFLNLVINAAQAIEEARPTGMGRIMISTRRDGGEVEIRFADNGRGVPPEIRDRIFDPFFTTKDVGKGTGQGLMICRDVVVTKHGGKLLVEGEYGSGATFVVRLPIQQEAIAE